tara:strand:- start:3943 stop:5514 length:1572 start_codon:yes stop_codon:yes gene_type:complete
MRRQFVLIGGGQTSVSAARTLRRLGFDGHIIIVSEESIAPYQRPPLSKEYLQGESDKEEIWAAALDWYSANDVELRLHSRVARINTGNLDVELEDGTHLVADAVLLATGGRPRRLDGVDDTLVRYLRNIEDSDQLREEITKDSHVVVVGAGFIGSEVAASARALGAKVTMLEAMNTPLQKVLGPEIGEVCARMHRENGVDLRCEVSVETVSEKGGKKLVKLSTGDTLEADLVVVGIGIEPNDQIARASEITVGNGIRVDEFCRTSAEGVFAAGDVANHYHPLYDRRMRVEHFDNATRQGAVAAKNMMGIRTVYDDPHWFWSDQYDHNLQYAGYADKWDDIVIRGSLEEMDFTAFYMVDGKIGAAFAVDRGADVMMAKTFIAEQIKVDPAMLRDEDVDLQDILSSKEREAEPESAADAPESEGEYLKAARSGQIGEGMVRRFVVGDVELAIARSKGKAYAVHNLCTHLACHLASGKVEDDCLTCLCHGSMFELETGIPVNPPATKPVRTYPVREMNGHIYVKVN